MFPGVGVLLRTRFKVQCYYYTFLHLYYYLHLYYNYIYIIIYIIEYIKYMYLSQDQDNSIQAFQNKSSFKPVVDFARLVKAMFFTIKAALNRLCETLPG